MTKFKLLFLICSIVGLSSAQVTIGASGGGTTQNFAFTLAPQSTINFAVSSAVTAADGTAGVDVSITTTSLSPAGLTFSLQVERQSVTNVVFSIGPAAAAAGASLSCPQIFAGVSTVLFQWDCALSGATSLIANGAVVHAVVQTAFSSGSTSTGVNVVNAAATTNGGVAMLTNGSASGQVSLPASVSAFACASSTIERGQKVSCTVTLNRAAPVGGLAVSFTTTDAAHVAAPSGLTVPAGNSTASVFVIGL